MNELFVHIADKYEGHYYGMVLLIKENMLDYIALNPLQEDIALLSTGQLTYSQLYNSISSKYELDITERNRELFDNVMDSLIKKGIIELRKTQGKHILNITGKKGKNYPDLIMVELTNRCNFYCRHCYKNASNNGNDLSFDSFKKIVSSMKGNASYMVLTGGEPCFNMDVNDILSLSEDYFKTFLITNGYFLNKVNDDIIKKLDGVQISLYGYDEESFFSFTGVRDAYENVIHSINRLVKKGITVALSVIVTDTNLINLEKYVQLAISLGVKSIMFGLSVPLGRLKANDKHFIFDNNTYKVIRNEVLKLRERYMSQINIVKMGDISKGTSFNNNKLNCQGGKNNIVITEKGDVVPCHMLCREVFEGYSYDEYIQDVINGHIKDYTNNVIKLKERMLSQGTSVEELHCSGFCEL